MSFLESIRSNIDKSFATISFNAQLLLEPENKLETIMKALKQIDYFSKELVCLNSWEELQTVFPKFKYSEDYTANFAFKNVTGEVYKSDDGFIILDPKVTIYDEASIIVEDFNLAKIMNYSIKQENEIEVIL